MPKIALKSIFSALHVFSPIAQQKITKDHTLRVCKRFAGIKLHNIIFCVKSKFGITMTFFENPKF